MIDVRAHSSDKFELIHPINATAHGWYIAIYSGFVWDGASIPRYLWDTIGCPCSYLYASCIHDALYASGVLDRKTSDKIFHQCLLDSGTDKATAKAMYLAVRVAGSEYYGKNKTYGRNYVMIAQV